MLVFILEALPLLLTKNKKNTSDKIKNGLFLSDYKGKKFTLPQQIFKPAKKVILASVLKCRYIVKMK